MTNGEWKGATVLAGAAVEALLLWVVQEQERRSSGAVARAISVLPSTATLAPNISSDPERWSLSQLIDVALHLRAITDETATQARIAKDFRNLIHPGRAARLGQVCDRGTALSALAAVEHVVRDLTP